MPPPLPRGEATSWQTERGKCGVPADALTTNLNEQQVGKAQEALDVALAGLKKNELIPTESPIGRMVFAAMERGDVETAFGHLLWESPAPAARNRATQAASEAG